MEEKKKTYTHSNITLTLLKKKKENHQPSTPILPSKNQGNPPNTCRRTTYYHPVKISEPLKGKSNCHIKIFRFSISMGIPLISDCT